MCVCVTSLKADAATPEGKDRNETCTLKRDEIGVPVQSWLWERVELMT